MKPLVLIAGTGRLGRSVGLHFLRCGYPVRWLSRTPKRREEFSRQVARDARRLARAVPGVDEGRAEVALYGAPPAEAPGVLVEAVAETREAKAEALGRAVPLLPGDALVLSATSSLLPAEVHPRAVVTHFFSPPELAGFAEVVWPAGCAGRLRDRVRALLATLGLEALEQDEGRAFAATRLLLPYQNELFRALAAGVPPAEAEEASRSRLFPAGHLAFLERAGAATVRNAVENYRARMAPAEAAEYAALGEGLAALAAGRAPKGSPTGPTAAPGDLRLILLCTLLNACYRLLDDGQLDRRGLGLILDGFFWAETPPEALLRELGPERVADRLRRAHRETGLSYFVPAASLGG